MLILLDIVALLYIIAVFKKEPNPLPKSDKPDATDAAPMAVGKGKSGAKKAPAAGAAAPATSAPPTKEANPFDTI